MTPENLKTLYQRPSVTAGYFGHSYNHWYTYSLKPLSFIFSLLQERMFSPKKCLHNVTGKVFNWLKKMSVNDEVVYILKTTAWYGGSQRARESFTISLSLIIGWTKTILIWRIFELMFWRITLHFRFSCQKTIKVIVQNIVLHLHVANIVLHLHVAAAGSLQSCFDW